MVLLRILIVDDHLEFLEAAADALKEELGLTVVGTVASGEDVLGAVGKLNPDVVVLDWNLPGLSGLQVLTALKELADGPRVIILTNHDHAKYRAAARQLGADGFICKADFDGQLVGQIRRLFA